MRLLAGLAIFAAFSIAHAEDPKPIELADMKSTPPKEWKQQELPKGSMRMATYSLPKADGDSEDADLGFIFLKSAGTLEQNLERQRKKFLPAEGKDKIEEKLTDSKVGTIKAKYQEINGTFMKKPFPMAEKFTPMKEYSQIYVVFDGKEGSYYLTLIGPAKTVEKNKKGFDEFLAAFK